MVIDWQHIAEQYQSILDELVSVDPLVNWYIKPLTLNSTGHKTKYGMADIKGIIYINQAFVGTTAFNLLDVTIRHELAHLCVGLQHGHDSIFKAKAHQFKAKFGRYLKHETAEVHKSIGYKYTLHASLENGEEIVFRRVHRKHRKYLNYILGRFKYLTINGVKVLSFRYTD